MKLKINVLLFVLPLFFSCKEMATTSTTNPSKSSNMTVEEKNIFSNQKEVSDSIIQLYRGQASGIVDFRIKNSTAGMTTTLAQGVWVCDAIFLGSEFLKSEKVLSRWIKFGDDNTYEYGNYLDQFGHGKYHYNSEESIILILDDDSRIKPQEFKVMTNNNSLVLVGQMVYQDNNMQAKFSRYDEKPAPGFIKGESSTQDTNAEE